MRRWWIPLSRRVAGSGPGRPPAGSPSSGRRRRWYLRAGASVLLALAAFGVAAAWTRFGAAATLSVVTPLVAVVAALGVGWLLMGRSSVPPVPPVAARPWSPPVSRPRPVVRRRPVDPWPVPPHPLPPLSDLPSLSTWRLCWAWRCSYVHLRSCTSADRRAEVAELRHGCLEELQRRDPAAFARWFSTARAAGDPTRFFCGSPAARAIGHPAPRATSPVRG